MEGQLVLNIPTPRNSFLHIIIPCFLEYFASIPYQILHGNITQHIQKIIKFYASRIIHNMELLLRKLVIDQKRSTSSFFWIMFKEMLNFNSVMWKSWAKSHWSCWTKSSPFIQDKCKKQENSFVEPDNWNYISYHQNQEKHEAHGLMSFSRNWYA